MKLLKTSICISFIIVSLSIGYYFIDFLPNQNRNEQNLKITQQEFDNNKKCAELGRSFYDKEIALSKNNPNSIGQYFEPEFKYNIKLNTCLYLGHNLINDTIIGATDFDDYIKDLYSNKNITEWSRSMKDGKIINSITAIGSQDEFNKAKKDLGFSIN